jgi:DNA-directed RNA polymerase specialized sigma24 family protein
MADQSASRVTEDMVTRASTVLWTEVDPVYQADARDLTDADVAAGKLREADDADVAANRAIVRHVLEAAFPPLPDDVRELLNELAMGGWSHEQTKEVLGRAQHTGNDVRLASFAVRAAELLEKYGTADG